MPKQKTHKMDRHLVATDQPYEVNYVRLVFYKLTPLGKISHPSTEMIIEQALKVNNSRKMLYGALRGMGWQHVKLTGLWTT